MNYVVRKALDREHFLSRHNEERDEERNRRLLWFDHRDAEEFYWSQFFLQATGWEEDDGFVWRLMIRSIQDEKIPFNSLAMWEGVEENIRNLYSYRCSQFLITLLTREHYGFEEVLLQEFRKEYGADKTFVPLQ